MTQQEIVEAVRASACFQAEVAYLRRGRIEVQVRPRLFKHLEGNLVRVVFPTTVECVDEGTPIAVVTLYDLDAHVLLYAHTIGSGPEVNPQLRAIYAPTVSAKPQPGIDGDRAVAKFIAWKKAAWSKFLNDELEVGCAKASRSWIDNYWKALDRMFGGGFLVDSNPGP